MKSSQQKLFSDLRVRLKKHNTNVGAKSTRGRLWKIFHFKIYKSRKKAMSEEYKLKKNKIGRKRIIARYLSTNRV